MGGEGLRDRERVAPTRWDRLLLPVHRWVWRDRQRTIRKLRRFAETEADGGRDLARAAELTADPLLRRLFLRHARDEQRHAALFQARARALEDLEDEAKRDRERRGGERRERRRRSWPRLEANWLAPGERGLDDLRVEDMSDADLLAFLHVSEKAAAGRFALYQQVLGHDPGTRAVFAEVLRDEEFHMAYTGKQLERLGSPARAGGAAAGASRRGRWRARAGRLWRAYLRLALALAGVMGAVMLTLQYFLLLPPFALLARRAARQAPEGWSAPRPRGPRGLEAQF